MKSINVAIVRGGPSKEYDISLATGSKVGTSLSSRYKVYDVVIDKEGTWYHQGVPVLPGDILKRVDVVFNATHGAFGEDGKLQQIFELFNIPYTGSGIIPSSVAMHKHLAKDVFKRHGIQTPRHAVLEAGDPHQLALKLFRNFPMPVLIKPVNGGSSQDIFIVSDFHNLEYALTHSFKHSNLVLVEEYIKGTEVTCGVINDFRNEDLYATVPLVINHGHDHFSKEKKLQGDYTHDHVLDESFKQEVIALAKKAHEILGLSDYSRSDFIVHPKRGVYLLEVNSQPGLTDRCLFPKSLEGVGTTLEEFLDHVLQQVLKHNKKT